MPNERPRLSAWLVRKSGPLCGRRHLLRGAVTRVGRSPENDLVVDDAPVVSAHHLEIRRVGASFWACDLNSTNGTYVNGRRIYQTALEAPCSIELGPNGPQLAFVLEAPRVADLDQTLLTPAPAAGGDPPPLQPRQTSASGAGGDHEDLLSEAVAKARMARYKGIGNQTVEIMREMLDTAIHRTGRKLKTTIGVLVCVLAATTAYGVWRIETLKREKSSIDSQILEIETTLQQTGGDTAEADRLVERLNEFQDQARALQSNLFYRVGVRERESPVEREIRSLMAEFGAETYSIPLEFVREVHHFVQQYQGIDRPHMEHALNEAGKNLETMRRIFHQENLPPDLAYMVLVESALRSSGVSSAGAAGLWQFTPGTAKAYGLKVGSGTDERLDAQKATQAACKYIRELILDFGAGSSVMLALAAYNLGPARVKQAIRNVRDPIKQRDFWYLYRVRALPEETREYVPKVIAVMIIGRSPGQFGF
jgi:soluble lytic murein transglycosylase-like protein